MKAKTRKKEPSSPVCLPIVKYEGRLWFYDRRLGELRNIYNPHIRESLGDFHIRWFDDTISQAAKPLLVYDADKDGKDD